MKKRYLPLLFIALMGSFFYVACQKTERPDVEKPGKGHIVETVEAQISGRVIDDQKLPVSGATVKVGSSTLSTDINGEFKFSKVQVDKTAALVLIEKAGFFQGIKTLIVDAGKEQQVSIQLIKKTTTGTFTGSAGGTVALPDGGGSVVFEPNSMMNPANKAGYSGVVSVSAFFINPTADNFQEIMPGTLRGIDANNNVTGLQSFGMMAVELSGANGERLQLAGGRKATLRFPIPTSLQGEAPATIPLWSLNDTTGLWQEEGTATKLGNEYVGTVGHFSFWNCDAPYQLVEFSATIKTSQNAPLPGAQVIITTTAGNTNISGSGYTNSEGIISGLIPANQTLVLKVVDKCRNTIHTQPLSPLTTKTNLGNISINVTWPTVSFTGTVVTCNGTPVTNGIVDIEVDNFYYKANITNGNFTVNVIRCNATAAEAKISAFDADNKKGSAVLTKSVTTGGVTTGEIKACGDLPDEYVICAVGTKNYFFKGPEDKFTVQAYSTDQGIYTTFSSRAAADTIQRPSIYFQVIGPQTTGTREVNYWTLNNWLEREFLVKDGSMQMTITTYNPVKGGYIEGTFTGNAKDSTSGNPAGASSGSFRVKYPK